MRKIFKYAFPSCDNELRLTMPLNAAVRHVAMQGDRITMWAEFEVISAGAVENRNFYYVGTGQAEIGPNDIYLGTVHQSYGKDGPVAVWHIYEERK